MATQLGKGTHAIGPDNGRLLLYTSREGVASKVGHDLTITFSSWSGSVTIPSQDASRAQVEATIEIASMQIVKGTGGALPLGEGDRRQITGVALRVLEAERYPQITFASSDISGDASEATMTGQLTIREVTLPVTLAVRGYPDVHASTSLRQSEFGIKPYRAFLGALKVADEVRIEIDLTL